MRTFIAGAIQMHVLHHASKHEINGAWMTAELARHGHTLSPGTVYPALHRMEAAGLLTSGDSTVNNRRVRNYRITETGRAVLASNRNVLRRLADDLLASPLDPPASNSRSSGPSSTTAATGRPRPKHA